MKILTYLLGFSALSFAAIFNVSADEHGGIHIHLPCGEEIEDEVKVPCFCMEQKPWYHCQHFDYYEDVEAQADRLQDDTEWPGKRDDFSDILLR